MRTSPFFTRTDWASFGITTISALVIYVATLTPEIGLRNDGVSATSALYGGVSMPAGFPVWTIWAWAFIKILPIGSIGWRAAFATALAGALACGFIALLVSRLGAELISLAPYSEILRASAGVSAGLVFGVNGAIWRQAVIPDPWPMSLLLLCVWICALLLWSSRPERRRHLYLAAFLYGLLVTNSLIAWVLVPAIPFVAAIFDLKLGRDLFLTGGAIYLLALWGAFPGAIEAAARRGGSTELHLIGGSFVIIGVGLAIKTRQLFSEWSALLLCVLGFATGWLSCFYLPLTSMTNPPINWGYPRTPEGFFHVITRGQYDIINMTPEVKKFVMQLWLYAVWASTDFGWPCLAVAAAPFLFWRQLSGFARRWLAALAFLYLSLAFLMVTVLDPTPELQTANLLRMYFAMSYLVLALGMGCGLILVGRKFLFASPSR